MNEIKLLLNKIELEDLYSIHQTCDLDFEPPLSSRTDIRVYCRKLLKYADIISVNVKGNLAGVLCIYANDSQTRVSYISSVAVLKGYRRLGLGNALVEKAISLSQKKGMSSVKLEVGKNNTAAQHLYRKFGFIVEKENDLTLLMVREYNGR
jgi:ribosomal protein S18 acetylase RimI-like enzyme